MKLERYEEAIASFDEAVKIQPDKHEAWYGRGSALFDLERYEDAIASFDQAVKIQPDHDETWYNKACCYALNGNIEQAIQNLQKAINLSPEEYREMAKTDSDFDSIREGSDFKR